MIILASLIFSAVAVPTGTPVHAGNNHWYYPDTAQALHNTETGAWKYRVVVKSEQGAYYFTTDCKTSFTEKPDVLIDLFLCVNFGG